MAAMTERLRINLLHDSLAMEELERPARRVSIRPIMVVSVGLILAAMGLVLLMLLGLVPTTFLTALLGFALTFTGGTMALIFYGEI